MAKLLPGSCCSVGIHRAAPGWTRAGGQPCVLLPDWLAPPRPPGFFQICIDNCLKGFSNFSSRSSFLEEQRVPWHEVGDGLAGWVWCHGPWGKGSPPGRGATHPRLGQMDNPRSLERQLLHRLPSVGGWAPSVMTFSWLTLTSDSR